MAEVILSTDSLSVLGGPASVRVETDFGAAGRRGSSIFFSNGDPNTPGALVQNVQELDIAINVLQTDSDYRYLYQYLTIDGTPSWVKQIPLASNGTVFNYSVSFSNGVGILDFPITSIVGVDGIGQPTPQDFVVQATPRFGNSAGILSVGLPTIGVDVDDVQKLLVPLRAWNVSPQGDLSEVAGNLNISFSISVGDSYDGVVSLP